MARIRKRRPGRRRIGRVSIYPHHGSWWAYFREGGATVRKHLAPDFETAERVAAQLNAQLTAEAPTLFSFTPTTVEDLQRTFLDHHEYVLQSSLATVNRYRSATRHLVDFAGQSKRLLAHDLSAEAFIRYLRTIRVSPNGHARSRRRPLRDKGIRFILETCRAMYGYAARQRRLPPYAENPFSGLGPKQIKIQDAKPVFVFDERQELAFLNAADDWSFPIHFLLAKSGVRPGELAHLLIEDLDLDRGWLQIRNKPELGWRIKTRRERPVPLIEEVVLVLQRVVGPRRAGPVFLRPHVVLDKLSLGGAGASVMALAVDQRMSTPSATASVQSRAQTAKLCRTVWRDAGAIRVDPIRNSFIRTAQRAGLEQATCPKSWRHTFATLLQDANVDPLVRQLTLGHSPTQGPESALGMTALYTHTRPQTQKREIERAMRLWPSILEHARRWSQGGDKSS